jgi:hypothetical protein
MFAFVDVLLNPNKQLSYPFRTGQLSEEVTRQDLLPLRSHFETSNNAAEPRIVLNVFMAMFPFFVPLWLHLTLSVHSPTRQRKIV